MSSSHLHCTGGSCVLGLQPAGLCSFLQMRACHSCYQRTAVLAGFKLQSLIDSAQATCTACSACAACCTQSAFHHRLSMSSACLACNSTCVHKRTHLKKSPTWPLSWQSVGPFVEVWQMALQPGSLS